MAIRITCPSCDASLSFDDEKAGKKVRCKKCEELIPLPAAKSSKKKRRRRRSGPGEPQGEGETLAFAR